LWWVTLEREGVLYIVNFAELVLIFHEKIVVLEKEKQEKIEEKAETPTD